MCAVGEDCGSGLCVTTAEQSVCTNECTLPSDCLAVETCDLVDSRRVCVPTVPTGGCSAGGQGGAAALLPMVMCVVRIRTRGGRRGRSSDPRRMKKNEERSRR